MGSTTPCWLSTWSILADDAPTKVVSKSRGNETAHQMKQCESLVKELMEQEDAWPFLQPVTKKDVRFETSCIEYYSSDAGDGIRIFRLWGSIPCLLMPWLLQSPEHQRAWYWLCRTDNMYYCSRGNFIYLGQAKSKIKFKMWIISFDIVKQFDM